MPAGNRRRREESDDGSDQEERPRQRRNRDEDSDAEDGPEGDSMDVEASADEQLAKKLIRYAIACDYSRTPIRRDGIKERVLGQQGRAFRRVFEIAQKQLRQIWGMELRELRVREKHSLEEKRKAIKSQSQAKSSSGVYVLTSTLPDLYRSPTILAPAKAPSAHAEASYAAFYSIIVTIIMLNGGELSDAKLRRYLHRMNAEENLVSDPTDEVLKKMQAQGYVFKQAQKDAASQGQDSGDTTTWYVGPRGQEEVGIDGASSLIRAVWGQQEQSAAQSLDRKIRASFGVQDTPNGEADGGVAGQEGEEQATAAAAREAETVQPAGRRRGRRTGDYD